MRAFTQWLLSSVGKKYLIAVTGLSLVGFLVTHLAGNLLLLVPDGGQQFNLYAYRLEQLGGLLYVAEVILLALFGTHLALAISVTLLSQRAQGRHIGHAPQSKGGGSHWGVASRTMIVTGVLIAVFLVVHIVHLKFGPSVAEGYVTDIQGEQGRDLYRLVVESFQMPGWVAFYCAMMIVLGLHLRHGLWSAFQSLGLMSRSAQAPTYGASFWVALLLAGGFFALPLVLWIFGGGPS